MAGLYRVHLGLNDEAESVIGVNVLGGIPFRDGFHVLEHIRADTNPGGKLCAAVDIQNAVAIGMLPDRPARIVGNTSLAAAVRLAATPRSAKELVTLAQSVMEFHLNDLPDFELRFMEGMLLP